MPRHGQQGDATAVRHGVVGRAADQPANDPAAQRDHPARLRAKGAPERVRVNGQEGAGCRIVLDRTRDEAEGLRGTVLTATHAADATPDDPEEFYAHELVGLTAYDVDGRELGTVSALTSGAQDLLTIRTTDGRDALVPFVAALVPEVDVAGGRLVVADRPGLVTPFPDEDES